MQSQRCITAKLDKVEQVTVVISHTSCKSIAEQLLKALPNNYQQQQVMQHTKVLLSCVSKASKTVILHPLFQYVISSTDEN